MEYVVIGKEYLDYLSKNSGKQVKGYNLHLTYEKEKCLGVAVLTQFVSEDIGEDINVNDTVEILYNRYGKVERVIKL